MRYLITVVIAALSLNAFGQGIPQLPYNPDENGDGLIGVPDLQALLAQYSLEFNSAVLSEDEESAIVYMGEMAHPVCTQACDNLPGFWHMATLSDLGLVWDEFQTNNSESRWFSTPEWDSNNNGPLNFLKFDEIFKSKNPFDLRGCYCAAHELPKVEYSYCEGSDIQACAEDKVTNGWFPLNGISSHHKWPGTTSITTGVSYQMKVQAFWRWAE